MRHSAQRKSEGKPATSNRQPEVRDPRSEV